MKLENAASSLAFDRILLRGVNWLGDAVMSTPALLRLREAYPAAQIVLLTPAKLADLWRDHPAINAVVSFEASESAFAVGRRLRAGKFQAGLILPNSFRSALEIKLAGVPVRIGYGGQLRQWLLTQAVPPRSEARPMRKRSEAEIRHLTTSSVGAGEAPGAPATAAASTAQGTHHIYQYLHLARCLGANPAPVAPRLFVREADVLDALRRFDINRVPGTPIYGLNPGAEYGPAKRWPAENFVEAAVRVQQVSPGRWLILGGAGDAALAGKVTGMLEAAFSRFKGRVGAPQLEEVTNLAGGTSLRELCAVLKACRVVLTNDTGPMHVAAALGTPVVALFGSTSSELTGPGLPQDPRHALLQARVPCAPCFLRECPIDFRCMKQFEASRVAEAVLSLANQAANAKDANA